MNRLERYRKLLQNDAVYKEYLHKFNMNSKDDVSDCIYAYVFVPALIEYVTWVLHEAKKNKIERLYFLARDGYMMYLTALELCDKLDIQIECRYLKVSRFAARVPEYHLLGKNCIDRIVTGGIDMTLKKLLSRTGMTDEQIQTVVESIDFKAVEEPDKEKLLDRILNYNEVMALKKDLEGSEIFFEYTYEASKKAYDATICYYRQEGLLENKKMALVDSGWIGTLQESINNLRKSAGASQPLQGYYFGMYDYPWSADKTLYNAYYFTPQEGLRRKVYFSNSLYEAVMTDSCGMTHHYEVDEQKVNVVEDLKNNPNKHRIDRNIEILKSILSDIKPLSLRSKYENIDKCGNKTDKAMLFKLFKIFMGNPVKEETDAYGDLLFSDDILEGQLKSVSATLSQEDIKRQRLLNKLLIMAGVKKGVIRESAWIEGSIVNAGKNITSNLFHARIYKYFVYIRKQGKTLFKKRG